MAGFLAPGPLATRVFATPYTTRTLHVLGSGDVVVGAERSGPLVAVTAHARVEEHTGGEATCFYLSSVESKLMDALLCHSWPSSVFYYAFWGTWVDVPRPLCAVPREMARLFCCLLARLVWRYTVAWGVELGYLYPYAAVKKTAGERVSGLHRLL